MGPKLTGTGFGGPMANRGFAEQSNQLMHQQQFFQPEANMNGHASSSLNNMTQRMFAAAVAAAASQSSMMQGNINNNNIKNFNENRNKNQRGNNVSVVRDDNAFPGYDRKRPRY
jgi:hypothetical protein